MIPRFLSLPHSRLISRRPIALCVGISTWLSTHVPPLHSRFHNKKALIAKERFSNVTLILDTTMTRQHSTSPFRRLLWSSHCWMASSGWMIVDWWMELGVDMDGKEWDLLFTDELLLACVHGCAGICVFSKNKSSCLSMSSFHLLCVL
jgi:hypothetical protein